jgi:hypothetical protein
VDRDPRKQDQAIRQAFDQHEVTAAERLARTPPVVRQLDGKDHAGAVVHLTDGAHLDGAEGKEADPEAGRRGVCGAEVDALLVTVKDRYWWLPRYDGQKGEFREKRPHAIRSGRNSGWTAVANQGS